jgi:hypothetical protein
MDSHRSFEFDRYPFDDTSVHDSPVDGLDDRQAYFAEDITHGMETTGANETARDDSGSSKPPR